MKELEISLCCLIISLFWGATNPLIKKTTNNIVKIESSNWIYNCINEILYLIKNKWWLLFFCINQCGSLLFIYLLQNTDLSLVVPAVNALTFLVTACVGLITKESTPSLKSSIGIIFILMGITLCIIGKL